MRWGILFVIIMVEWKLKIVVLLKVDFSVRMV